MPCPGIHSFLQAPVCYASLRRSHAFSLLEHQAGVENGTADGTLAQQTSVMLAANTDIIAKPRMVWEYLQGNVLQHPQAYHVMTEQMQGK